VAQEREQTWPAQTVSAKPWTRWWWPASAGRQGEHHEAARAFAAAGIGGVEITPIYGARGAEARYLDFLSPQWMDMLDHTTREAARLGLAVDMATGTGWPFGGPTVSATDGSSTLASVDGKLTGKPTAMKVKRAGPGGEGLVLDPYSTSALGRYLQPFSRAFAGLPRRSYPGVRAQFHDSFEYYNASWTAALPEVFRKMHGYDIQTFAAQIAGEKPLDDDTLARVKGDYRRTPREAASRLRECVGAGGRTNTDSRLATRRMARPGICSICTPPRTSPRPNPSDSRSCRSWACAAMPWA
jgi:hypothetical protein